MKKTGWAAIALASACVALTLAGRNPNNGGDVVYALALPFIWAGKGLRALSLSGGLFNVLALLLYGIISLMPLTALIGKRGRQKGLAERCLLLTMCAYLFFLMYYMVNPSMLGALFTQMNIDSGEMLEVLQAILCMAFYALLIAYWVRSIIADTERITVLLKRLLNVLGAAMIVSVFYINAANLRTELMSYAKASSLSLSAFDLFPAAQAAKPNLDGLMAWVRFISGSVPTLLLLSALPAAQNLVTGLNADLFHADNRQFAAQVADRCRLSIYASLALMIFVNFLQLLLGSRLMNVHITGQMPLSVLALSLAMMLLARYLMRSSDLKKENDMMI